MFVICNDPNIICIPYYDLLIDKFGVLGTAAGIGGLFAGFKNVGINTLVAY